MAEPGGICISESVRSAVGNKLPLDYEFLGEQSVKNIAEAVRAYRVLFYPSARRATRRVWRLPIAGLLVAGLAVIVLSGVFLWRPVEQATFDREANEGGTSKPAIAVLPFANVNVDPQEEYFADGMTDDLITDLSKLSGLYVIARNSVFSYKNKAINVSEVGRELGAKYILEGSIRRAEDRVRINIQLVDASSGHHLWAERYDRSYQDFFSLQDEVIAKAVSAVSVTLTDTEITRIERPPTASLEAYDYYLRAEQAGYIGGTKGLRDTMDLYAKAVSVDPEFADAHAGLARAAVEMWRQDVADVMPGARARAYAYESAARALEIDPANGRAYSVLAVIQLGEGHHEAAIKSARKAVSLGPSDAEAHLDLGLVLAYAGEPGPAIEALQTALRLNPKPTPDAWIYAGVVYFFDEQYDRAINALSKARASRARTEPVWTYLAAAHSQLGETDKASAALEGLLKEYPASSIEYYRTVKAYFRRAEDLERYLDGLKSAGLPDWPYGFQSSSADPLRADELQDLWDSTWAGRHRNGTAFLQEMSASGAFAYRSKNSFQTGTVSIRGEKLCQRIDGAYLDNALCGYVYRNPEGSRTEQNEFIILMPDSLRYFSIVR